MSIFKFLKPVAKEHDLDRKSTVPSLSVSVKSSAKIKQIDSDLLANDVDVWLNGVIKIKDAFGRLVDRPKVSGFFRFLTRDRISGSLEEAVLEALSLMERDLNESTNECATVDGMLTTPDHQLCIFVIEGTIQGCVIFHAIDSANSSKKRKSMEHVFRFVDGVDSDLFEHSLLGIDKMWVGQKVLQINFFIISFHESHCAPLQLRKRGRCALMIDLCRARFSVDHPSDQYPIFSSRGIAAPNSSLSALVQRIESRRFYPRDRVVFSSPTSAGERFAAKYAGLPNFLVFR